MPCFLIRPLRGGPWVPPRRHARGRRNPQQGRRLRCDCTIGFRAALLSVLLSNGKRAAITGCSFGRIWLILSGGADQDRTDDLLSAIQVKCLVAGCLMTSQRVS